MGDIAIFHHKSKENWNILRRNFSHIALNSKFYATYRQQARLHRYYPLAHSNERSFPFPDSFSAVVTFTLSLISFTCSRFMPTKRLFLLADNFFFGDGRNFHKGIKRDLLLFLSGSQYHKTSSSSCATLELQLVLAGHKVDVAVFCLVM